MFFFTELEGLRPLQRFIENKKSKLQSYKQSFVVCYYRNQVITYTTWNIWKERSCLVLRDKGDDGNTTGALDTAGRRRLAGQEGVF